MSEVWNYFEKTSTVSAKCKICGVDVPRHGNTTNLKLKVHRQKHPQKEKQQSQSIPGCQERNASSNAGTSNASTNKPTSIDQMFKESQLWASRYICITKCIHSNCFSTFSYMRLYTDYSHTVVLQGTFGKFKSIFVF